MDDNEGLDQETPPDITAGGTQIEIPPDPPEGEGGEAPAGGKPSRKERREARGRDLSAENREATARAERAEREAQQTREALAELRGRVEAGEKLRTPAVDPYAAKLAALRTKISQAIARMSGGGESAIAAEDEWHAAEEERAELLAERRAGGLVKDSEERITRAMPQQMDPRDSALVADFPFLATNPAAKVVANGHVARLVAMESRDMDNPEVRYATLREGAALAARDLNLKGARSAPTNVERDRLGGTRGGDSGAGNGGAVRVHLSESQIRLAETLFRDLPKEQAHAKWWKEIGSKNQSKGA